MAQYTCIGGIADATCDRKFNTLNAALIHNQQNGHSVKDSHGKLLDDYPECDE